MGGLGSAGGADLRGRVVSAAGARRHRRGGAAAPGRRMSMPIIQSIDYLAIAPPLVLAVAALAVLVLDAFLPRSPWTHLGALGAILLAGVFAVVLSIYRPHRSFCVGDACSYVVVTF